MSHLTKPSPTSQLLPSYHTTITYFEVHLSTEQLITTIFTMNIDQLLNPKPVPTLTMPEASTQGSNQYLEHESVPRGTADTSSKTHFLTGNDTDQEREGF